jgi:hypothetical protein
MFKCNHCGIFKDVDSFYKNKTRRTGLEATCKKCYSRKVEVMCAECKNFFSVNKNTVGRKQNKSHLCKACCTKLLLLNSGEGPLNHNWKGGATLIGKKFYNSLLWKKLREEVFTRDNYTCQDCKKVDKKLQAHHLLPRATNLDKRLDVNNIISLCRPCHEKRHDSLFSLDR